MAGLFSNDHVYAPAPWEDGEPAGPDQTPEFAWIGELEKFGGPAFPGNFGSFTSTGMTLRDYFAGQVLAGMSAGGSRLLDQANAMRNISRACYEMADAMLAARSEEKA